MSSSIEEVRQFWDRRPCNIRHSTQPIGTAEYFAEVERRRYFVEPHIPAFADFPRWAGKKVLEVGCGIGTDAACFARAGADYTGIDLSPASLEVARQRFEMLGLSGRLELADAEHLSAVVEPASFDLVYSFGVIHHTPDPAAAIAEIRKVIRPDGELRLMLYARESWKAIMIEAGLDQPEAQSGCPIAFAYTAEEAERLLQGFTITSIRQDHIFPYVVEKYVRYEYEPQPWFAAMPPAMFRALAQRLGWHLLITAKPV